MPWKRDGTRVENQYRSQTEAMRVEALRQASRDRLERAEQVARFGHWELNLADEKIHASIGTIRIFGLPGMEWSLTELSNQVMPEDQAVMAAALTNLIEHNQPYSIEFGLRLFQTTGSSLKGVGSGLPGGLFRFQ